MLWISTIAGVAIMAIVMMDVFLTVLYARVQAGFLSQRIVKYNWLSFRAVAPLFGKKRVYLRSLAGPAGLVVLIGTWVIALVIGSALIIQPQLGKSFLSNQGATPRDFATAMYIGGDSMNTSGASDISPHTPGARLFYTCISFLGLSVMTLSITYLLEVYNALQQRNTLAIKLHVATAETGDAAELIAALFPQGQDQIALSLLVEHAAEMAHFEEAHHFYPVIFYFDFVAPHYATSRILLICLDMVSLMKTCLDDSRYGWIKQSVPVSQLGRTSRRLMEMMNKTYIDQDLPAPPAEVVPETKQRWLQRYEYALARLREAGVPTVADPTTAAEEYVELRREWDSKLSAIVEYMHRDIRTIDAYGQRPERAENKEPFAARLREE